MQIVVRSKLSFLIDVTFQITNKNEIVQMHNYTVRLRM